MRQVFVTPAEAGLRIEGVMPAEAGIQRCTPLDSGVRRNDGLDVPAGGDNAMAVGRLLVFFGLLVVAAGLLLWFGVPIGRLPGDILVRRGGFSFYIPVTTSVIAGVVLTVLLALLRR